MRICEDLLAVIQSHTDRRGWSHSMHWERDAEGRLTLEGAKQALADLHADGRCEDAVRAAQFVIAAEIRERYAAAARLRGLIEREEAGD